VPAGVWAAALVLSGLTLGPALGPGSLLNLDLVLFKHLPLPSGVWGLGPDLPRRLPLWAFVTWASQVVDGEVVGKLLLVATLSLAFAGMYRFTRSTARSVPAIAAVGAAGIYAFGPFLVTRVAVGHLMVVWAMALLPWAAPSLLAAHRSGRRTFLWSLAFALGGVYGAIVCGAVLIAGQVAARGRRAGVVAASYVTAQLVWLVPLAIVATTAPSGSPSDASAFPADLRGIGALGRLVAGQGFWSPAFQVGGRSPVIAAAGVVLGGLAIFGTRELPKAWRAPLTALAAISFVVSASSGLAGTASVAAWLTSTPIGAPFRETQRMLVLFLFWVAPTAALGALRLARRAGGGTAAVYRTLPLVLAIVLATPGMWGAGGQLRPVQLGPDWSTAQRVVHDQPGTLVALPWYEYYSSATTGGRVVLDVMPYWFGGDVITATDPRVNPTPHQEGLDPRERSVAALVDRLRRGEHVSSQLAALGVRWVAVQHAADWEAYRGLTGDPGLKTVVAGTDLTLLRVNAWPGAVRARTGARISESSRVAPLRRLGSTAPAVMAAPYQAGWMQGGSAASEATGGLIALPGGSTTVWYWPTIVVLVTDVAIAGVAVASIARLRRRRRSRRFARS
jgi:hypothetical protein